MDLTTAYKINYYDSVSASSESSYNASLQPNSNVSTLSGLSDYAQEYVDLKQFVGPPSPDAASFMFRNNSYFKDFVRNNNINKSSKDVEINEPALVSLTHNRKAEILGENIEDQQKKLILKNLLLQLSEIQKANEELLSDNKDLRIALGKHEIDNQAMLISINSLKDGLAKQYVHFHNLNKEKSNLIDMFQKTNVDKSNLQKEKEWYREQLYLSEREKERLKGVLDKQKLQTQEVTQLKLELNTLHIKYENMQLNYFTEKEKLFSKFQKIIRDDSIEDNYKNTILNLQNSLSSLDQKISDLNKENFRMCEKFTKLTKYINEKEVEVAELKSNIQEMESKTHTLSDEFSNKVRELVEIKREVCKVYSNFLTGKNINGVINIDDNDSVEQTKCKLEELNQFIKKILQTLSKEKSEKEELNSIVKSIKKQQDITLKKNEQILKDTVSFYRDKTNNLQYKLLESQHNSRVLNSKVHELENDVFLKNNIINDAAERYQLLENCCNKLKEEIRSLKNNSHNNENISKEATINKCNFIGKMLSKIQHIEMKTHYLNEKSMENSDKLRSIMTILTQKKATEQNLSDLKILLKVKDLEFNEKQKRYETNVQTLLQKVNEHMKQRKSAEKKYNQLEELYDTLKTKMELQKIKFENKMRDTQKCANCTFMSERNNILNKEVDQLPSELHSKDIGSQAIKDLSITFQQKTDDLKLLENNKARCINLDLRSDEQVLLKNQLQELQRDLSITKQDKRFFQRLCNDLKAALQSHISYIKLLKSQIDSMKERSFKTISASSFNLNIKSDEKCINLLATHRDLKKSKPATGLASCIETLNQEVSNLNIKAIQLNNKKVCTNIV